MGGIGIEKQRVAGFQRMHIIAVTIIDLPFKHIDRLDPAMLKGFEDIRFRGQGDQVWFDDDARSVRSDMAQQIVLVIGPRALAFNLDPFAPVTRAWIAGFLARGEDLPTCVRARWGTIDKLRQQALFDQ